MIRFVSRSVTQEFDSSFIVTGDLTIKKTTKSMNWDVNFNGAMTPPYGTPGFTATSSFTLQEFNLSKNKSGDKFVDVGDTVFVRCSFRLEIEGY